MSDEAIEARQKLLRDLKVTAGSRFNAASRLARKEKGSTVLVAVYSAVLICVSIANFALPLSADLVRYSSFGGIAASVLLLVMSMRNFAHKFGVEAEQLHRSALAINELRREIEAAPKGTLDLAGAANRYGATLQQWSVNHTESDFLKYKYKHKWEFQDISDIPDKDLPNRMFQEANEISALGVSVLTFIGTAFIVFIGYIAWDIIGTSSELSENRDREAIFQELTNQAYEAGYEAGQAGSGPSNTDGEAE